MATIEALLVIAKSPRSLMIFEQRQNRIALLSNENSINQKNSVIILFKEILTSMQDMSPIEVEKEF